MRPTTHNVLALDLAAVTGWCVGPPPTVPYFGADRVGMEDDGRSYAALGRLLERLFSSFQPTAVAIEAPIMKSGGTTFQTIMRLHGYAAMAHRFAAERRLPIASAPISSVRKTFLGRAPRSREAKRLVIAACQASGLAVSDHNAADAVAVWFWAHKVKWPGGAHEIGIDPQKSLNLANGAPLVR